MTNKTPLTEDSLAEATKKIREETGRLGIKVNTGPYAVLYPIERVKQYPLPMPKLPKGIKRIIWKMRGKMRVRG